MKKVLAVIYMIVIAVWFLIVCSSEFNIEFTDPNIYLLLSKVALCFVYLTGIALSFHVFNNGEVPIVAVLTSCVCVIGMVCTFLEITNANVLKTINLFEWISLLILIIFSVQSRSDFHFKYKVVLSINVIVLLVYLIIFKELSINLNLLSDNNPVMVWVAFTIACLMINPALACLTDRGAMMKDEKVIDAMKEPCTVAINERVETKVKESKSVSHGGSVFDRKPSSPDVKSNDKKEV